MRKFGLMLLVGMLSACASTQPPSVADMAISPPATPSAMPEAAGASPGLAPDVTGDALVTPTMAELGLSGERYAALGDPQAPITMIEFSDFG